MDNGIFVCVLGWRGVGVWYGKRSCAIIIGLRVTTWQFRRGGMLGCSMVARWMNRWMLGYLNKMDAGYLNKMDAGYLNR
jgi:hypothetical protein